MFLGSINLAVQVGLHAKSRGVASRPLSWFIVWRMNRLQERLVSYFTGWSSRVFQNVVRTNAAENVLIALNHESKAVPFCDASFEDAKLTPLAFHFLGAQAGVMRVLNKKAELLVGSPLQVSGELLVIALERIGAGDLHHLTL
jgi:hypothetical protein